MQTKARVIPLLEGLNAVFIIALDLSYQFEKQRLNMAQGQVESLILMQKTPNQCSL